MKYLSVLGLVLCSIVTLCSQKQIETSRVDFSELIVNHDDNASQMVMADALNVRSAPTKNAHVIEKLPEGTIVQIQDRLDSGDYHKIIYASQNKIKRGYVSSHYLTPLYLIDGDYKVYLKIKSMEQNNGLKHELTLFEVTRNGRKQLFSEEYDSRGYVNMSLRSTFGLDDIKRIVEITSDDDNSCTSMLTANIIIQSQTGIITTIPAYQYENDIPYTSSIEIRTPSDTLGQNNKLVLTESYYDRSSVDIPKVQKINILATYKWNGTKMLLESSATDIAGVNLAN